MSLVVWQGESILYLLEERPWKVKTLQFLWFTRLFGIVVASVFCQTT
jgi:hypothetical protein